MSPRIVRRRWWLRRCKAVVAADSVVRAVPAVLAVPVAVRQWMPRRQVEGRAVDGAVAAQIRAHDLQTITPGRTLEQSARLLLQGGVTNAPEYNRVFGL